MRELVKDAVIRGACLAAGITLVITLPAALAFLNYIHRDKK